MDKSTDAASRSQQNPRADGTSHAVTQLPRVFTDRLAIDYDVLVLYNSCEWPAIESKAARLRKRRLRPWIDVWHVPPGIPWQRELGKIIRNIPCAAVFIGKSGVGPWQREEIEAVLAEFVRRGSPVIPVILADCPRDPELPVFLANRTMVDFRKAEPSPEEQLIWGIREAVKAHR